MKMSKRITAGLIAGLLALTPCAAYSLTAFAGADDSYTITVNETIEDYAYKAYQIFSGTLKDGKLAQIDWATGFGSAGFLSDLQNDAAFCTDPDDADTNLFKGAETAEDVANVLKNLDDETDVEKLAQFAKLAKKNIGTAPVTDSTYDTESGKHKINVTGSGYYLIEETEIPAGDPAGENEIYSRFMMKVVESTTVKPKRELPELHKKIDDGTTDGTTGNTASIGDTVTYKLTTKVPNMIGYDKYFFNIKDTLSAGLTYVPDSIKVTVNSVEINKDEDGDYATYEDGMWYYVTTDSAGDAGTNIAIVFENFLADYKAYEGKDIVVTYDAILNNDAVIDGEGNPNTASLTYSNNPNEEGEGKDDEHPDEPGSSTPTGKTPDETVKTFTTEIEILKVDKDNHDVKLDGVKFRLTGAGLKSVLTEKGLFVKDDTVTGEDAYYLLTNGDFTNEAPNGNAEHDAAYQDKTQKYAFTTVTGEETGLIYVDTEGETAEGGKLKFSGLNAGEYTITEIKTQEGYNLLSSPITVTIGAGTIASDLKSCTFTYAPEDKMDGNVITIENSQGSTLPSTGGIGTKLFYLIGGMLVVGSGVILVTKKRMSGVEK